MNLYTDLAHAKDELRRAKDHEQTIRAIVEGEAQIFGKSADDRKRELAFLLAINPSYKEALSKLRWAEYAVDVAQAAIDQAETERRDREWLIRLWLADALREQHDSGDSFDDATLSQMTDAIQRIAQSRDQYAGVARDMLDAYNSGIADRINGAGEFEDDDGDPDADYQADMQAERYSSGFDATRRRMVAQREINDLYPTK